MGGGESEARSAGAAPPRPSWSRVGQCRGTERRKHHAQTFRQGHPAPSLVGRTLRQVSWLSARRFPPPSRSRTSGKDMGGTLADDSCGGSSGIQALGLAPDSLLIPMGTINGRQSRLAQASASRSISLNVVGRYQRTTISSVSVPSAGAWVGIERVALPRVKPGVKLRTTRRQAGRSLRVVRTAAATGGLPGGSAGFVVEAQDGRSRCNGAGWCRSRLGASRMTGDEIVPTAAAPDRARA